MNIATLSVAQLKRAVQIKEEIEGLNAELERLLGSSGGQPALSQTSRPKMSVAGRARIAEAQRARWAKVKGIKKGAKGGIVPKKRTLSATANAKIAAAAKARWAKAKAAGKNSL